MLRSLWRRIPFCHIAGVPVEIHSSCLIYPVGFLVLSVWLDAHGPRGTGHLPEIALRALLMLDVLWGSLLLHEFAHVLVARWCGTGTRSVVFLPIGAVAVLARPMRDTREFWVAAAGPAVSLALAGVCRLALNAFPYGTHSVLLPSLYFAVKFGVMVNWIIALFNLIPCFPMDGGRMLRSLLAAGIGLFSRAPKPEVFDLATRIVVRCVNPIVATVVITLTISISQMWSHLVLFPLVLIAAELEYRAQRDQDADDEADERPVPRFDRTASYDP